MRWKATPHSLFGTILQDTKDGRDALLPDGEFDFSRVTCMCAAHIVDDGHIPYAVLCVRGEAVCVTHPYTNWGCVQSMSTGAVPMQGNTHRQSARGTRSIGLRKTVSKLHTATVARMIWIVDRGENFWLPLHFVCRLFASGQDPCPQRVDKPER